MDWHPRRHISSVVQSQRKPLSQAEPEPASCRFFCCHCSGELWNRLWNRLRSRLWNRIWNRIWNRLSWFTGKLLPRLPLAPVATAARVSTASRVSRGWSGTHAAGSRCPGWNRDSGQAHTAQRQHRETWHGTAERKHGAQQLSPAAGSVLPLSANHLTTARHMCISSSHSNKYTNINIKTKSF